KGDVDALLDSMDASWKMQAAAKAKFGAAGEKAFAWDGPTEEQQLKDLDGAKVEETGDTPTLTLPAPEGQQGKPRGLKKAGGGWKVDAVGLFDRDGKGSPVAGRVELAQKLAAIAKEMAKDIAGGKMTSAAEAYQVFWTRSQMAMTGTGSAPATRP